MTAVDTLAPVTATQRFAEPLKDGDGSPCFGYRLTGHDSGPHIVVAGHAPVAPMVFDRLMAVPTLPRMRGALTLIRFDRIGPASLDALVGDMGAAFHVDRVIVLPLAERAAAEAVAHSSYWTVLRAATALGMISGRGIPQRH